SVYSLNEKKTLLMDCDLHKKKDWAELGIDNKMGLSTFLSKQVDQFSAIIQPTNVPNLHVITSGSIPPNPGELLANGRMDDLMESLRATYDVIILDTPPISIVSDSLTLVHRSDLTLLIIRYGYSKKSFIDDINNLKSKKGLKNIYAVLNDVLDKELAMEDMATAIIKKTNKNRLF